MIDQQIARAFMRDLARLINPEFWEKTAEAYLAMLPMLRDVPDRCWRSKSCLEAVALAPRKARTPNLGDLRAALWQWLRDNPEGPQRIENRDGQQISSEARAYVAKFKERWVSGADRKMLLSIARTAYPREAWEIIRREYALGAPPGPAQDAAEEAADLAWWNDRILAIESMTNPTAQWRAAQGMLELLRRPTTFPRPAAVEWLRQISNAATLAGADTNPFPVKYAPDTKNPGGAS